MGNRKKSSNATSNLFRNMNQRVEETIGFSPVVPIDPKSIPTPIFKKFLNLLEIRYTEHHTKKKYEDFDMAGFLYEMQQHQTTVGDVYHLLARLISNSVLEMTLKKDSEQDETADSSGMMTPTETEQSGRITQADICENCEENNQVVKNGMCQTCLTTLPYSKKRRAEEKEINRKYMEKVVNSVIKGGRRKSNQSGSYQESPIRNYSPVSTTSSSLSNTARKRSKTPKANKKKRQEDSYEYTRQPNQELQIDTHSSMSSLSPRNAEFEHASKRSNECDLSCLDPQLEDSFEAINTDAIIDQENDDDDTSSNISAVEFDDKYGLFEGMDLGFEITKPKNSSVLP